MLLLNWPRATVGDRNSISCRHPLTTPELNDKNIRSVSDRDNDVSAKMSRTMGSLPGKRARTFF
jgi:hypothetical protein